MPPADSKKTLETAKGAYMKAKDQRDNLLNMANAMDTEANNYDIAKMKSEADGFRAKGQKARDGAKQAEALMATNKKTYNIELADAKKSQQEAEQTFTRLEGEIKKCNDEIAKAKAENKAVLDKLKKAKDADKKKLEEQSKKLLASIKSSEDEAKKLMNQAAPAAKLVKDWEPIVALKPIA